MHYYLVRVGGRFAPAYDGWGLVPDKESAKRFRSHVRAAVAVQFWRTQTDLDVTLLGPFMEDTYD